MEIEDVVTAVVLLLIMGLLVFVGYATSESNKKHAQYLQEHGCIQIAQANTTKTKLVGKITYPVVATVYECKDGIKTELN